MGHITPQVCESIEYSGKEWTHTHNSTPSCMHMQYIMLKQQEERLTNEWEKNIMSPKFVGRGAAESVLVSGLPDSPSQGSAFLAEKF